MYITGGNRRFLWILPLFCMVFILSSCRDESEYVDPGSSSLGVGSINGTIRGDGALLEGADITTVPETISDASSAIGEYSLDGLAPQSLKLVVEKAGYVTQTRNVSIVAGKTYTVDFDLTPSTALGRLTGTVSDGYIPLEGVTVSTVPSTFSYLTGADGRYDYNNVQAGKYRVDASLVGFWPVSIYVDAIDGVVTTSDISLGRRNDGIISGYALDNAGNAVAGAAVSIFWDEEVRYTTSGTDGFFAFYNVTTGYYIITASATNYYNGSHSLRAYGGVESNGTVILSLTSTPSPVPGAIAGTVFDEDYLPISGATVTLNPASATPVTTTSETDGSYFFTDVSSGTHTLTADEASHVSDSITVDVGPNITGDGVFALKRTG